MVNILTNSDFESGLTGWTFVNAIVDSDNRSNPPYHVGRLNPSGIISQNVSLTAGKIYNLSFRARSWGLSNILHLSVGSNTEMLLTNVSSSVYSPYSYSVGIPSIPVNVIKFWTGSGTTFFIDDVILDDLVIPPPPICNTPSFNYTIAEV